MKPLITAIITMLALSVSHASNDDASPKEICASYSQLAKNVVGARYRGASMAKAMTIVDGSSLGEAIVRDAYDLQYMHAEPNQKTQASRFANRIYAMCYKQFDD